jgi:hypothetical protein
MSVVQGLPLHGLGDGIEEQHEYAGDDDRRDDVSEDPDFTGHWLFSGI